MSRYRNILVAFDGTEQAVRALDTAIGLAAAGRARLTILTAAQPVPYLACVWTGAESVEMLRRRLIEGAAQELDRAAERVPDDVSVTTILTTDPINPALLRVVAEGCYDLLVVGTRGRGRLRSALLGSVSRFALRRVPLPVLVVGQPTQQSMDAEVNPPTAVPGADPGLDGQEVRLA